MLDQTLAQLMQRILEREAISTPVGTTSRRLQDDLGLGRIQGKTLYLSDRDRREMREILQARGYSTTSAPLNEMSRSARLVSSTPNEKAGGGALKTGRVSIKALPGKTLNISGETLCLPDGCHVNADWRRIVNSIGHDSIILVENYEVFDQIHLIPIDLPRSYSNALVLYRGDKTESRLDNVSAFLREVGQPVIAFTDIDPKGLHIAGTCPRLVGVLAPSADALEDVLKSATTARHDLYKTQLPGVAGYLRSISDSSPLFDLWALLQKHRAGAVQERWLAQSTCCILWSEKPN